MALHPYYIARAFGGLLFLLGAAFGVYNIWMTMRAVPGEPSEPADAPVTARPVAGE